MLKRLSLLLCFSALLALAVTACGGKANTQTSNQPTTADLQKEITDLQALAPGLGEIMMAFQTHIAKVWFAGENGNWPLAKFETGEIIEGLDGAKASRPATGAMLDMFNTTYLTKLNNAINAKDKSQFETAYKQAVDGCNSCHAQYTADAKYPNGRPFIVITVPTTPPVSNQQWSP